jgi:hypothetical protein
MKGPIMALDLATVTGWAIGEPGTIPAHGSIRFGGTSSHEATFAKAMNWMAEKCKVYKPSLVVWEAPLVTSFRAGRTTSASTLILVAPGCAPDRGNDAARCFSACHRNPYQRPL